MHSDEAMGMMTRGMELGTLLLLFLPFPVSAQTATVTRIDPPDGRAVQVHNPRAPGDCLKPPAKPLKPNTTLPPGALICTDARTRVVLVAEPRTRIELGPDSETVISLEPPSTDRVDWLIQTTRGWVRATLQEIPGSERFGLKVDAGNVVAAPKSTDYLVMHDKAGASIVWVMEGEVQVTCPAAQQGVPVNGAVDSPCSRAIMVVAGQGVSRLDDGPFLRLDQPPETVQELVRDRSGRLPRIGELGQGLPPPSLPPLELPAPGEAAPVTPGNGFQTLPATVPVIVK